MGKKTKGKNVKHKKKSNIRKKVLNEIELRPNKQKDVSAI
jgi:hypothetical protein